MENGVTIPAQAEAPGRPDAFAFRIELLPFAVMPFACGYFVSYLLRNALGTLSGRMMLAFDLGPEQMGLVSSMYFLSFALFQIPAGLLIDRYGPRRVQAVLLIMGAIGTTGFALATNEAWLMASRAMIGLGTSSALATGMKAIALHVPERRRVPARALFIFCGGLGAITATLPLEWAAGLCDWRDLFLGASALQLLIALLLVAGPNTAGRAPSTLSETLRGLRTVMRHERFWRVTPLSSVSIGAVFAIHGLWAARWLSDVHGLTSAQSARVLFCMACGLSAGAPLFGLLSIQARARGISMAQLFGACIMALMAVEAAVALDVPIPSSLLLGLLACFGAMTVLGFSMVDALFPETLVGRANAVYNVTQIGTTFVMQAGFGAIVVWCSHAGLATPSAYAAAIFCLIAVQALCFVWFARR